MIENKLPLYLVDPDFLSKDEVETIFRDIEDLPWYVNRSIGAADDGLVGIEGDLFLDRLIVFSEPYPGDDDHRLWPIARHLAEKFCNKHGLELVEIYRTRANLTCFSRDSRPLPPHIDLRNKYKHFILIVFFNDTDGDTIMYDLAYDGELHTQDDLHELARFSPTAGGAALWNGDYFHAWERPKHHDYRLSMIVNMAVNGAD